MHTKEQIKVRALFDLVNKCIAFHKYYMERLEWKERRLDCVDASYCRGEIASIKDFLIDLNLIFDQVEDLYDLFDVKNM